MAAGLGLLRLSPSHFWAMTPREFVAALGGNFHDGGAAPGRSDLDELMARFPDSNERKDE